MSDLLSMGVGVVVGGAVSSSYYRSLGSADAQAKKLGERWKETNKRASAVGDLVRYRRALDGLRRKQGEVGASNTRVARGIADLERRYREAKRQVKAYGIEVGDAARMHRRLQMELRATEHQQRGQRWRSAGAAGLGRVRGMAMGAAGAAYGVGRLLQSGMERETQTIYLKSVIVAKDGDVGAAVKRFEEHVRRTALNTMASEEELLEIGYQLSSAGLDDELSRVGSTISHKVAEVTRGSSKTVASVIGIVMNNMGDRLAGSAEEKLALVGDVLAQTQLMYKFDDFGQLGESIKESAADAVGAKLPLEQYAAVLGMINNAGLEGGRGGTALKGVLRGLAKAEADLGAARVRDASGNLDLLATLEKIDAATRHLGTDAKSDLLRQLFGEEGMGGVVPLLENLDKLRKGVEDTGQAKGVVDEKYAELLESTAGQWRQLTSSVGQAGDAFAKTLLPAVRSVVGVLGRVAEWVGVAVTVWPGVGRTVAFAAAAFVGLTVAIGIANALAWLFGGTVGVLGTVLRGVSRATWLWTAASKVATAAAWLFNAALWANPITWVVGGVVAFVALAAAVWHYWEPISVFFKRLWSHETIQRWLGWVGDAVESVKGFLRWVGLIDEETPKVGDAVAATARPLEAESPTEAESAPKVGAAVAAVGVAVGAALPAAAQPEALPPPLPAFAQTQDVVAPPGFAVPIHAPPPAPATTSSVRVNASIVVNPPAGADEQAIAREVARQIRQAQRRAEIEAGLGESDA